MPEIQFHEEKIKDWQPRLELVGYSIRGIISEDITGLRWITVIDDIRKFINFDKLLLSRE